VESSHIPVVSDFRVADVAAGGQGAPLVPHVDRLLFSRPGRAIALQNLGGIGNVTYVPDPDSGRRLVAFDTGPANMIVDALVRRISGGAESFDRDGRRGARGRVDGDLLAELLDDRFLELSPPKTAGRERYGREFVERFWRRCDERRLGPDDRIATATRFTAAATALGYRRFVIPLGAPAQVVASGGGALNPTLMAGLAEELAPIPVVDSSVHGIPVMAKEALAFAILAYEWARGRPAGCPEATGASRPVVLGKLTV
jgi:anhydro-N-acetylmuramic acid kinase